ncbi:response regulator transcription factor [Chloroflexota bacterium]
MKNIRVLLAGTRQLLLIGIRKVLEDASNIDLLSFCSNGEEAIQGTTELKPDIVILDGDMPHCVEVTHNIKNLLHEIGVIILTPSHRYNDPLFILEAEANGYIDSDMGPPRLVDIIERIYEGGINVSPMIALKLFQNRSLLGGKVDSEKESVLSKREEEVLTLVAKGLTNKEIANALFVAPNTAKAHLHSIMTKMKAHSRSQVAYMARDKGIL